MRGWRARGGSGLAIVTAIVLAACAGGAPATTKPVSGAAATGPGAAATSSGAGATTVVAAPATSTASNAAATTPPPPENVRLGSTAGASDAGFFIAEEKGYFREQGLIVDTTTFASATEIVAPLGAGQLDVGGGAPSAGLGNALARGITLKIVA